MAPKGERPLHPWPTLGLSFLSLLLSSAHQETQDNLAQLSPASQQPLSHCPLQLDSPGVWWSLDPSRSLASHQNARP